MPRDASIADPKAQLLHEHRRKNERWFVSRWKHIDGPQHEREFRFSKERKWRFDFAFPNCDPPIAVEIDSAAHKIYWNSYTRDVEKMNAALFLGWQVFRVTGQMIKADDVGFLENLKKYILEKSV